MKGTTTHGKTPKAESSPAADKPAAGGSGDDSRISESAPKSKRPARVSVVSVRGTADAGNQPETGTEVDIQRVPQSDRKRGTKLTKAAQDYVRKRKLADVVAEDPADAIDSTKTVGELQDEFEASRNTHDAHQRSYWNGWEVGQVEGARLERQRIADEEEYERRAAKWKVIAFLAFAFMAGLLVESLIIGSLAR